MPNLTGAWIDLDAANLTVPAETMKRTKADKANGAPHMVPLAPQAVAILRELHRLTGHGLYVFPSLLKGERCISENTVRGALRRMGYTNDDMTAHGFRALAKTLMLEQLDIGDAVIEAQLSHQVKDTLGRAYNRTQYLDQRRDMMTKGLTTSTPCATVHRYCRSRTESAVDLAAVRDRLGFTQAQCAARFGGRWRVSGIGRLATATGSGPRWCCST